MARNAPSYPAQSAARTASRYRKRRGLSVFRVAGWLVLMAVGFAIVFALAAALLIERQARTDETTHADAIIVLGAAEWNGKPSPVLRARLDHAYDLYAAGYAPMFILTGGVGEGDTLAESEVARRYLVGRGVPDRAIVLEREGKSSYESMQLAAVLMQQNRWHRALLVSDPFHMFRLKQMATDLDFDGFTSPTLTSPIRPGSEEETRYVGREVATLMNYLVFRR